MWTVWRSWCEGPEHRKDTAARGRAPDERGGSCWPRGAPSARTWHRAVRVTALATPVLAITTQGPCATRRRHLPFSFCSHSSARSPFPFRAAEPATAGEARGGSSAEVPRSPSPRPAPSRSGMRLSLCTGASSSQPGPVHVVCGQSPRHEDSHRRRPGAPAIGKRVLDPGNVPESPVWRRERRRRADGASVKRQRRPTPRGICPRDRGGPGAPPSASAGWGPRQPGRESRSSLPPPFCPKNLPVKTCLSASLPTETRHRTL